MHAENALAFLTNSALCAQKRAEAIFDCNETTAQAALVLTPQAAQALVRTQAETLKATGRVEFGTETVKHLILAFYDSPYLTQSTYEETLHALIELFYTFKNETEDRLGDQDLMHLMRSAWDGVCGGSVEMLGGEVLPLLARKIRMGELPEELR